MLNSRLTIFLVLFTLSGCKTGNPEDNWDLQSISESSNLKVCADEVNLRKDPSTKSKIIGELDENQTVKFVSVQNDWAMVKAKTFEGRSTKGWIYKPLLCIDDKILKSGMSFNTPEIIGLSQPKVCADALALREEPNTSSNALKYLSENTELYNLKSVSDNWYKVEAGNSKDVGYVHKSYVCNNTSNRNPGLIPEAVASYDSKGTAYYPYNNLMEGGFYDRIGEPLTTLQDFLDGKVGYVSVAMDKGRFKYGTLFRIPELEIHFNKVIIFKVVDTGSAFIGKGTSRIDICVANQNASFNKIINGKLTLKQIVN